MKSYHLYDDKSKTLIIVLQPGLSEAVRTEANFHEKRERYWIKALTKERLPEEKELGLNERKVIEKHILIDAHRLASDDQRDKFGEYGFTPYHQAQLDGLAQAKDFEKIKKLLDEGDRKEQYDLVLEKYGPERVQKKRDYEQKFQSELRKIQKDVGGINFYGIEKNITKNTFLADAHENKRKNNEKNIPLVTLPAKELQNYPGFYYRIVCENTVKVEESVAGLR